MSVIRVVLQDEAGTQVSDAIDLPTLILPPADDPRFICFRFVDPYGDTIFNRLQMEPLLAEIRSVSASAHTKELKDALLGIEQLAIRCQNGPHLYLKLLGD